MMCVHMQGCVQEIYSLRVDLPILAVAFFCEFPSLNLSVFCQQTRGGKVGTCPMIIYTLCFFSGGLRAEVGAF